MSVLADILTGLGNTATNIFFHEQDAKRLQQLEEEKLRQQKEMAANWQKLVIPGLALFMFFIVLIVIVKKY